MAISTGRSRDAGGTWAINADTLMGTARAVVMFASCLSFYFFSGRGGEYS